MRRFCSVQLLAACLLATGLMAAYKEAESGGKKWTEKDLKAARKAVDGFLDKAKSVRADVKHLRDKDVARVLPGFQFYTVRYRQFPVMQPAPMGLRPSNVLAADRHGKVQALSTIVDLRRFLASAAPAAKSDDALRDVARAAVRLGQELHQDGFYKFALLDEVTRVGSGAAGKFAAARATLQAGGTGHYAVEVRFDGDGKVTALRESNQFKAGPRPICQATKLLDPDPIVRGMAEQAILFMGRPAKEYLDEQRAKARPELQRAIDAIWKKICEQEP